MEKIEPGKYVEFAYDLYKIESDGKEERMYTTPAESPEAIIFGVTQGVFRPLEEALENLLPGQTFDVTAKPAEAFGEYDPERVVMLEKDIFAISKEEGATPEFDAELVKPGAMIPMLNNYGQQMYGMVVEVTDKEVKMDFNHILAGKDVRFKGKVLNVRDATPEELHPAEGCGSCGCGDSCGCGEQSDCGGGCCGK